MRTSGLQFRAGVVGRWRQIWRSMLSTWIRSGATSTEFWNGAGLERFNLRGCSSIGGLGGGAGAHASHSRRWQLFVAAELALDVTAKT